MPSARFLARVNPTRRGELITGPLMILPIVVGLGLFQVLPLVTAVLNSFRSFNPFTKKPNAWAGLDSYRHVLSDPGFQHALLITFVYVLLMILVIVPLALALAVLLDRRFMGTVWARGAILGALASSEAVAALIWNQMYQPGTGLFDSLLRSVGLPEVPFLTSGPHAILAIVAMTAWKDVGLPTLIFLGGLQNIPPSLHEAAEIDGASPWRTFRRITLPLLRPSMVLAAFIVTVSASRLFTPIMLLTQGGPNGSTMNVTYYSYSQAFEFSSVGPASASVVLMLLLMALFTLAQTVLLGRRRRRVAT